MKKLIKLMKEGKKEEMVRENKKIKERQVKGGRGKKGEGKLAIYIQKNRSLALLKESPDDVRDVTGERREAPPLSSGCPSVSGGAKQGVGRALKTFVLVYFFIDFFLFVYGFICLYMNLICLFMNLFCL